MADRKVTPEVPVKDYAGGWITEKVGTEVPGFLRLAIPVIGLSCVAYLILYINGEVDHAERGPLVRSMDAVTGDGNMVIYLTAALALAFVITVAMFAFSKSSHD